MRRENHMHEEMRDNYIVFISALVGHVQFNIWLGL
jgi:hypothetical protein